MILCCGEALIDMIPSPNEAGESGFTPHSGGAVFNTAIALGRLGAKTGFLSGISTDLFGEKLRGALVASNVDIRFLITSDRPTTLAFVQLAGGQARYTFYDENTAGRMLGPSEMPDVPEYVTAMYFGGISLISKPCADFYAALAVREAKDKVIILDPNIRASFIKDDSGYRARLDKMIAHTDILKVSDEDLNWIVPGDTSLNDKVSQLRAMGPKIVVLTKGRDGAGAFFGDGQIVEVPAQLVKVVDTVGAGDTFNAGFLASLSDSGFLSKSTLDGIRDVDLKNALLHGSKVAAVTVSRSGANPPWADEVLAVF
ncbi:MAG: carbohydrate kinase [Marinosulfonomonas sp.]|nr:carbohydrate kinase [Marinosulfonomonas sp.]